MSTTKKRKPGAPVGNFNAMKHGLYSSRLPILNKMPAEGVSSWGTEAEIEVIRVMLARHLQMRVANPPKTPEESLTDLRVISFAVARLAALIRLARNLPAEHEVAYSENWMEELMADILSEKDDPDQPDTSNYSTDLLQ